MLFQTENLLGHSLVPILKRAAILCDKIFVQVEGLGGPDSPLNDSFINKVFGGDAEQHDLIGDKQFRRLILRESDFSKSERSEIPSPYEFTRGEVFKQAWDFVGSLEDSFFEPVAAPWRGVDYKARGSVAIQMTQDILMPDRMRSLIPEAVGLLSPLHKKMLNSIPLPFLDGSDPLVQLATIRAADYAALSWYEVLKLRRSSFLEEFRIKLAHVEKAGSIDMQQELWGDLWRFAAENKPSPGKTAMSGLLANLPIGPVNPFSVGVALADAARADTQRRKYGWLYFVMESNPNLLPLEDELEDLSQD